MYKLVLENPANTSYRFSIEHVSDTEETHILTNDEVVQWGSDTGEVAAAIVDHIHNHLKSWELMECSQEEYKPIMYATTKGTYVVCKYMGPNWKYGAKTKLPGPWLQSFFIVFTSSNTRLIHCYSETALEVGKKFLINHLEKRKFTG